jgi:hypothetical protein
VLMAVASNTQALSDGVSAKLQVLDQHKQLLHQQRVLASMCADGTVGRMTGL